MADLQIRRIGYALGAEVRGIDLRRPLDDGTVAQLRAAWLEHLLLCFPDQHLEKEEMIAFTGRFGTDIDDNKSSPARDPENTHLLYLTNKPIAGKEFDGYKSGQSWHSDRSYTVRPMMATFVHAKEIPPVGGDTMFANQYMAYETLSPTLRGILDGLDAVHDTRLIKGIEKRSAGEAERQFKLFPPVVHPAVRTHPETGRRALYLGDRVRQFVGMAEEESKPLLNFLNEHSVRYELTYRHRWTANDLVMWDNRCLVHVAPSDYDLRHDVRHMWRTSLWGPTSGKLYDPEAANARELVTA